jgi:hypothetical protein
MELECAEPSTVFQIPTFCGIQTRLYLTELDVGIGYWILELYGGIGITIPFGELALSTY